MCVVKTFNILTAHILYPNIVHYILGFFFVCLFYLIFIVFFPLPFTPLTPSCPSNHHILSMSMSPFLFAQPCPLPGPTLPTLAVLLLSFTLIDRTIHRTGSQALISRVCVTVLSNRRDLRSTERWHVISVQLTGMNTTQRQPLPNS